MIPLLFSVTFAEMVVILILLFRTPLRMLVAMSIDKVKQGRGPIIAKTVAATVSVVFFSRLYGIMNIHKRSVDAGTVNPTDQLLMAYHILEATLMGFSLFLAMMIDRFHYYYEELRTTRKSLEVVQKEIKGKRRSEPINENETDVSHAKARDSRANVAKAKGEIKSP